LSQEAEAADWEPSLEYVGSYDTYAHNIAILGNYAYVADWDDGLLIINIEDPANLTLAGSYDTGNSVHSVAISGNYAYVTEWNNGLVIVNIEDLTNPTLVGSYDINGEAFDVTISGNYAYLVSSNDLISILDIEDPANPTLVGSYDTDNPFDVTILGNYAYVPDGTDGLLIVNIEDPANPTLVGSYDTNGASCVTISGNYAYVANISSGLVILNIEDPTNPTLAGSYDIDTESRGYSVAISGNYVYVVYGYNAAQDGELVILEFGYTPLAVIDSISPSPARFSDEISFSGSGEDYDGIIVAYEWTSSRDGFLSDEEDFSTTGLSGGSHNISLRVQDNSNRWSDYHNITLVVYPNSLPIAVIDSISPSPAEKGTTVFFNGTSSDSDGTIVAYLWESSIDGELSTEEDFTTTNLSIGNHTITFMVQDDDGAWSASLEGGGNVSIPGISLWIYASPVAIAGQDSTGTPGVPLQFSGAGTDEDGTIAKYEWDFDGDGVFEWSSTENGRELNIYNNEDTYTATLRVTDNDGFTDTDTVEVTISEKKIQIDDEGNVTVTDAGEDEEGIPGFGIIGAVVSIGLIARFRRD
jgi:hypothetical protein